jgi:glycosyltransferase involved in cell wall biosynthesis
MRELAAAIRATQADLVHANSFCAGVASMAAALTTRRKLLVHARDLADFGILTKLYGRSAERVIAVSHAVKRALASRGARAERIEVIYNGYDFNPFHRTPSCARAPASPPPGRARDFVFAHVGQWVPWKNHAVFLNAAAYVADRLPQAQFVVVGDDLFQRNPSYKQGLFNMARSSSAASKIHFWGWQTHMEDVWPRIDCLVHTAEREPFGRVVVEAMAHQIPVIAVAAAGPAEIIQADQTGVLVPTTAIHTLGEAMLRVARDREFAATIAAAGYRHARSSFTASQTAARVQQVYEDVLSA